MADIFMVFDVESIGLHGDGFAVAWVVVNRSGQRLGEGCMACPRDLCAGTRRCARGPARRAHRPRCPSRKHLRLTTP